MAKLELPDRPGKVRLGLKAGAATEQLLDRLRYRPEFFEFYTQAADLEGEAFKKFKQAVTFVQRAVTPNVIIHHPMQYQGRHLDQLLDPVRQPEAYQFLQRSTDQLINLAYETGAKLLVHGGYGGQETQQLISEYPSLSAARETVFNRLDQLIAAGHGRVMIENGITPSFMYGDPQLDEQIIQHQWPLVCDVSHVFIGLHGDMDLTALTLKRLRPLIQHYHLVDSMGQQHDSLPLGRGRVDWNRVLPLLNPGASMIYEVPDATDATCRNMLESYHYLRGLEIKWLEGTPA